MELERPATQTASAEPGRKGARQQGSAAALLGVMGLVPDLLCEEARSGLKMGLCWPQTPLLYGPR